MADIIRLTAQEVEAVATRFGTAAEETTALLNELSGVVEGMSSGWEGDAYNAFVSSFEEIRTNLNGVVELYEGLQARLKGVVQTMQETDSALAASMG
ncbi:MAG: WXG100 family type VII secretion target [Clostridia bacterium]|nr:WXG100 family type VII secretion target [Clostridia bacterium]